MILILKRIKPSTMVVDIETFIAPSLKGGLLSKSGRIESVSIQMIKEKDKPESDYVSFVRVEPDAVAKRVIKQLNRKPLNGKPINVCEYFFRYRNNDRRSNTPLRPSNDRRRQDRRRTDLAIIDVTDQRKNALPRLTSRSWQSESIT